MEGLPCGAVQRLENAWSVKSGLESSTLSPSALVERYSKMEYTEKTIIEGDWPSTKYHEFFLCECGVVVWDKELHNTWHETAASVAKMAHTADSMWRPIRTVPL